MPLSLYAFHLMLSNTCVEKAAVPVGTLDIHVCLSLPFSFAAVNICYSYIRDTAWVFIVGSY